jgi:sugar lactone lactonase YvrE
MGPGAAHGKVLVGPGSCDSSIAANFNGTPIAAGNTLWFSAVMKVHGLSTTTATTINLTGSIITFTANGAPYSVTVPDSAVTFDPAATSATVSFDPVANRWNETLPVGLGGNFLLDAVELPLTSPLPGGIQNVTWAGHFTSSPTGPTVNWQWSAAVYSQLSIDYNSLGVKPVDDNKASQYKNSDHAGTPENFKAHVIGGAMGGGGSNFTGSLSGTAAVSPCLSAPKQKIYVTNSVSDTLTTYNLDGTPTTPTITSGVHAPNGIVVDAAGKIYVANVGSNTITTYNPDGTPTTPTITDLSEPFGVAVDAAGKIYVADLGTGTVRTYNPDGTATSPTITSGLSQPRGLAIDAGGKIYVADQANDTVTTYNPDGTPTTPTITGLNGPAGVAVDAAGKIYVTNNITATLTTYNPDGTPTTPTITGLAGALGVTVDAAGKIYVANAVGNSVTTYKPDGTTTTPTITSGLNGPAGVAVH